MIMNWCVNRRGKSCNHWIGWSVLVIFTVDTMFLTSQIDRGFLLENPWTFEDPYDLNALHAIDDKLAQLVPESEWEAPPRHCKDPSKSIE